MATPPPPAFVYRISTGSEWAELQRTGCTLGGDLDRSTSCFHLSDHAQIIWRRLSSSAAALVDRQNDLYLLQIDTAKIADGLIYEAADGCNYFPDRSFAPLQLSAVIKAEKIELANNAFTCSLLDGAAI